MWAGGVAVEIFMLLSHKVLYRLLSGLQCLCLWGLHYMQQFVHLSQSSVPIAQWSSVPLSLESTVHVAVSAPVLCRYLCVIRMESLTPVC